MIRSRSEFKSEERLFVKWREMDYSRSCRFRNPCVAKGKSFAAGWSNRIHFGIPVAGRFFKI